MATGSEKMSKSLGNFTTIADQLDMAQTPAPTGCSCCAPSTGPRSR